RMTVPLYLDKPELTPLFRPVIEEAASPLAPVESRFAADGTGFHTSTYARWFDHKHGKDKKYQKWVHLHAMVGARTNVMIGVEVTEGARGESPEFVGLLKATATRFNIKEVSADKAYLSNENLEAVEALGAIPYIPFKLNSRPDGNGEAWKRLWHYFHAHRNDFLDRYHQRSNSESSFSAIKRKFGGAVRAKNERAQFNEVLAKVHCHNLACLIHEIHELGIAPKFWTPRSAS
ncbi:MAG: transposase, partial [Myxococcales bacterium]|nr:transposase [Myxococcales bacterium]